MDLWYLSLVYAQKHLLKAHTDVPRRDKRLIFCLSFLLSTYFVNARSKCFDEAAGKRSSSEPSLLLDYAISTKISRADPNTLSTSIVCDI